METVKAPNFFKDILEDMETEKEERLKMKCELHGEYTAIKSIFKSGRESITGCPECEKIRFQKQQEEEERLAKKEYEEQHLEECRNANIRLEFYDKYFSDYEPKTEGQKKALEAVEEMQTTGKGKIILLGSNGAGKTMLGSILARNMGGKIYTMYEIATLIRQSYTPKAEKSELEIVNELATIPFLCIDEVGRIRNTEAVQDWFSYILDKRHSEGLPFMLIGNLHFKKDCKDGGCPKCFENYFDKDILSRLHEDTTIIVLKTDDKRREKNTLKYYSD